MPNRTLRLLDDKLTAGQAGLASREVRERLGLSPLRVDSHHAERAVVERYRPRRLRL